MVVGNFDRYLWRKSGFVNVFMPKWLISFLFMPWYLICGYISEGVVEWR